MVKGETMPDKWFIGFIVIFIFVYGFALGWKAGCSFEGREDGEIH